MLDENQLTVIDENGNELLCEILFTFDSDDYNKSYVVYYPAGAENEDEEGNVDLHVSAYIPGENNEGGELLPVETEPLTITMLSHINIISVVNAIHILIISIFLTI